MRYFNWGIRDRMQTQTKMYFLRYCEQFERSMSLLSLSVYSFHFPANLKYTYTSSRIHKCEMHDFFGFLSGRDVSNCRGIKSVFGF